MVVFFPIYPLRTDEVPDDGNQFSEEQAHVIKLQPDPLSFGLVYSTTALHISAYKIPDLGQYFLKTTLLDFFFLISNLLDF
jgi:hypothetical protein